MTQNTLSILGLGTASTSPKSSLTPVLAGGSLPVDAIDGIDQQALDAALEFAALLLEQGNGAVPGGNVLPVVDGNALPVAGDGNASQLTLENAGEDLLAQITEVLPGISLPETAATLPQASSAAVLSLADSRGATDTLDTLADTTPVSAPVLRDLSIADAAAEVRDVLNVALPQAPLVVTPKSPTTEPVQPLVVSAEARRTQPTAIDTLTRQVTVERAEDPATLVVNRASTPDGALWERRNQTTQTTDRATALPLPSTQAAVPVAAPVVQAARRVTPLEGESLQRISFVDIGSVDTAQTPTLARTLPQVLPTSAGVDAAARPVSFSLETPFDSPDWSRQFAERVGWVIHAKLGNAQIKINPEHLGPVDVSIEVDEQLARVQFVAAAPLTRDAIENSLPRLRELLEQQGLQLAESDVQDGSQQQQRSSESTEGLDYLQSTQHDETQETIDAMPLRRAMRHEGIIDTFV